MRIVLGAVIVVGFGCGGSKHARNPHDAQRDQLEASRPKAPLEVRERTAFEPAGERCGQGPFRLETDALRAPYAEQVLVYACGAHEISGNYRLAVEGRGNRSSSTDTSAFGFDRRDNAACKSTRVAPAGEGTGSASSTASSGSPAGSSAASTAPATKPVTLTRVASAPEQCAQRTQVFDITYQSTADEIALDGHLTIDIWSDEPNDLENLVFVIEKRTAFADMTVERWQAYLAADHAWHERYMAFLNDEVAAGRTTLVDTTVKSPPPPPPRAEVPPPRPSEHARWIPGYWHYDTGTFHWIAGLWDVPDADIAQDLTVHAPTPPPAEPPPTAEQPAPEPRPAVTAVWTPGQWQWDGHRYIWVTGAWRIPPSPQHTWQPARWTISTRGAIFVPGGWRVRIGR